MTIERLNSRYHEAKYPQLYRGVYYLANSIVRSLVDIEELQTENKPPEEGPAILAAKHVSNWDPFLLGITNSRAINAMAKKELWERKIWLKSGYALQQIGALRVNRQSPQISELKGAIEVLQNKKLLVIFPEATRTKNGVKEFKDGPGRIAVSVNCPIVPIDIKVMSGARLGRPFQAKITYGEHINAQEIEGGKKEKAKYLNALLFTRMVEMHGSGFDHETSQESI